MDRLFFAQSEGFIIIKPPAGTTFATAAEAACELAAMLPGVGILLTFNGIALEAGEQSSVADLLVEYHRTRKEALR